MPCFSFVAVPRVIVCLAFLLFRFASHPCRFFGQSSIHLCFILWPSASPIRLSTSFFTMRRACLLLALSPPLPTPLHSSSPFPPLPSACSLPVAASLLSVVAPPRCPRRPLLPLACAATSSPPPATPFPPRRCFLLIRTVCDKYHITM